MRITPAPRRSKRGPVVRIVTVLLVLVTLWHVFAQFLWIAPASQLRTLVPGNVLTAWQIPFFGQSWSVFAPDPINGDYHFKVRAIDTTGDGQQITTGWVDATDAENKLAEHNLFPSRAAGLAVEQATKYKNAWDKLNDEQKKVVATHYWKSDDWKARLENGLTIGAGGDQTAIANANAFISANAFTTAYATQVARAMWGQDIGAVQFEIYRQNVIPFAERHNPDAQPEPKQLTPTGWRGQFLLPGQSDDAFADTFRELAEVEDTPTEPTQTGTGTPTPTGTPAPSKAPAPQTEEQK